MKFINQRIPGLLLVETTALVWTKKLKKMLDDIIHGTSIEILLDQFVSSSNGYIISCVV